MRIHFKYCYNNNSILPKLFIKDMAIILNYLALKNNNSHFFVLENMFPMLLPYIFRYKILLFDMLFYYFIYFAFRFFIFISETLLIGIKY